jgi:hypothetical protein
MTRNTSAAGSDGGSSTLRFGLQGRVGGVALLMSATRNASRPRQAWRPSSRDTAMTGFKVRSAELSDLRSDCLLVSSIKKPLFFAAWLARITSTPRHRLRDLDPAELLLRDFLIRYVVLVLR